MPLYDAKCKTCGAVKEFFARMADCEKTPECHGAPMERVLSAPMLTLDYAPYQAVVVDKKTGVAPVIRSRKEHREFLKRNGYRQHEADSSKQGERKLRGDFNVRQELTEATHKVLNR